MQVTATNHNIKDVIFAKIRTGSTIGSACSTVISRSGPNVFNSQSHGSQSRNSIPVTEDELGGYVQPIIAVNIAKKTLAHL